MSDASPVGVTLQRASAETRLDHVPAERAAHAPVNDVPSARAAHALEIAAISFAMILLEISYTRIFSFKLYYYFTYMIIGIALLGLGSGGVLVAVLAALKRATAGSVIALTSVAGAAMVLGGYFAIASIQLRAFTVDRNVLELLKLLALTTVLFGPFLMGGTAIAAILTAAPSRIGRLYAADLVGAAAGCALAVPLIATISPPACVMASGAVLAATGARCAARFAPRLVPAAIVLVVLLVACAARPMWLPDPAVDPIKVLGSDPAPPVVFSRWSSVFRVDVLRDPLHPDARYMIAHDGQMGAAMLAFSGDPARIPPFDHDTRALPFRVVAPGPDVMIIGSAGGHEILASLYFDARHVTGVELNPVTVSLLTDHFADFTGHLASHPRVTVVNAEGRSFLERSGARYDLIWFVAPDSYAAMNAATASAFVLSESYLYTAEMLARSLEHLTADGIVCAQFGEFDFAAKPNRTLRYVTTAREALRRHDITDVGRHMLVATTPPGFLTISTILLKREPFTAEEVARFRHAVADVPESVVRWAPGSTASDGPVATAVALDDVALDRWVRSYRYDVSPVSDDSPFFWHFARFRDALRTTAGRQMSVGIEDSIGERLQVVLLVFVAAFAAVALFLPLVAIRDVWREIPHKRAAGVYFAALGVGFMFFEVSLIQTMTLFLGYPTYSLSVTLFALLVFAGLGSLASERWMHNAPRALVVAWGALAVLAAFYAFGMPSVVDRWVGAPLAARIAFAIAAIAPLGLCLGAFMPIGLRTVAAVTRHRTEFIAWAWAVNGFFSVISSILSTILAMVLGFKAVLGLAVIVYLCGALALRRIPRRGVA